MKKLLGLIMILVLSLSMVACSSNTDTTKTDTETPVVEEKDAEVSKDTPKEQVEIVVSAAASLTDAMGEIAEMIKADENIILVPTYGSSGALQKQIEEGAPSDVFISAGQKQMTALEEKSLIAQGSKVDLLKNTLVLIVPADNKEGINNIQDVVDKKVQIALAETETVPVGQYSKAALTKLELWDKIDTGNIVQSKDVSEVLTHVEQGNVAAGMVYSSDAVRGDKVKQVEVFDENLHDPIVYPAAIIESSKQKEAAKTFLDYLQTDKVKAIFEKYGFKIA